MKRNVSQVASVFDNFNQKLIGGSNPKPLKDELSIRNRSDMGKLQMQAKKNMQLQF